MYCCGRVVLKKNTIEFCMFVVTFENSQRTPLSYDYGEHQTDEQYYQWNDTAINQSQRQNTKN